MNRLLLVFSLLFTGYLTASAQVADIANVWLGNTYGNAHDWNDPANWSKGHVPTAEELVFIPNLYDRGQVNYPTIKSDAEVGSIQIHPLAKLTIEQTGSLYITDGSLGAKCAAQTIVNQGTIFLDAQGPNNKFLLESGLLGDIEIMIP